MGFYGIYPPAMTNSLRTGQIHHLKIWEPMTTISMAMGSIVGTVSHYKGPITSSEAAFYLGTSLRSIRFADAWSEYDTL